MAGYLGNIPSAVPLTSADIADGIITSAKIADGTIVNADINASSAIAISKISATGTANQVLRMNSGATALEFASASSDFVKITSTNITSSVASVDIDGFFDDTTYGGYVVYGHGIELSSGSDIRLRVRQSNTLLSGANYSFLQDYAYWSSSTAGTSYGVQRSATSIRMFDWSRKDSNSIANFHFHFSRPTVAGLTKNFHGQYYSNGESSGTYWSSANNFGGEYEGNTSALSGITLFPVAGNMTAGSIVMYGLKK